MLYMHAHVTHTHVGACMNTVCAEIFAVCNFCGFRG